jgi:hypothetical protein
MLKYFLRALFSPKKSIEQKKMAGKEQFVVIVVEKNNLFFFMLFSRVIQVEKINELNLDKKLNYSREYQEVNTDNK